VGQNLGLFFGPPIVGALIADGNWASGILPLVAAGAIDVGASVVLWAKRPRLQAEVQLNQ
jgi:hypothetical protein